MHVATAPIARWEEGQPQNLEAAALDALEWLQWLDTAMERGYINPVEQPRLRRAIASLYAHLGAVSGGNES